MACLNNKHIGKQRVEAMQILHAVIFWRRFMQDVGVPEHTSVEQLLNSLYQIFKTKDYTYMFNHAGDISERRPKDYVLTEEEKSQGLWIIRERVGFGFHSATRMWLQYPDALKVYLNASIDDFEQRGGKNNMRRYVIPESYDTPPWVTSRRFIATMHINLLKKNAEHYVPVIMQIYGMQQVAAFNENTGYEVACIIGRMFELDKKLSPEKLEKLFDWVSRTKEGRPVTDYFWPID